MMNNAERRLWVLNDEGLYLWWKRTKLPMAKFIATYKYDLDALITGTLNNTRPQHKRHLGLRR